MFDDDEWAKGRGFEKEEINFEVFVEDNFRNFQYY